MSFYNLPHNSARGHWTPSGPVGEFGRDLGRVVAALPTYKSGVWVAPAAVPLATEIGNACLGLVPLHLPPGRTITAVAIHVTAAGSAGSVHRVAIYDDNGQGFPGNLLTHVPITTTGTGVLTVTGLSIVVPSGGLVWVGAVQQGAPSTLATVVCNTSGGFGVVQTAATPVINSGVTGYTNLTVTGTPPSTFVETFPPTILTVRVLVKID